METIKVIKVELLAKLKENKSKHREMFEKALEGYRQLVIEELEKRLKDARKNRKVDTFIRLTEPRDQTKDYDRAIAMLEMDVNEFVELDQNEFSHFVLDDWEWSDNFKMSNTAYFSKVGYAI